MLAALISRCCVKRSHCLPRHTPHRGLTPTYPPYTLQHAHSLPGHTTQPRAHTHHLPSSTHTPFRHTPPNLVHTQTTSPSAHTHLIIPPPLPKHISCPQTRSRSCCPAHTHHPPSCTHTAHHAPPTQRQFLCPNTGPLTCLAHTVPPHTNTPPSLPNTICNTLFFLTLSYKRCP